MSKNVFRLAWQFFHPPLQAEPSILSGFPKDGVVARDLAMTDDENDFLTTALINNLAADVAIDLSESPADGKVLCAMGLHLNCECRMHRLAAGQGAARINQPVLKKPAQPGFQQQALLFGGLTP